MGIEEVEVKVTDSNFEQEVIKSDKPVLVDFWAEWCGPCRMVAPVIEEIAQEYKEKLKVCKINVDEASNTASQYGVMSIPTIAVFKNGKVV
ncbi:MAG: thioredoxin, partial [Candidatus Omnitrophica bacterium]|nr:thioredoxin [Candidatus Omnitrophota bacterium]